MEISSLTFRSDKNILDVTNIFLFAEGIVIFNIEKVENTLIDGLMGDPQYLTALLGDGTVVDIQSLCEMDSFTYKGEKIIIEKDQSRGSIAEKKLLQFYSIVGGPGSGNQQSGIS